MALMQFGITPDDFYDLCPCELSYAVFHKQKEINIQVELEQNKTRIITDCIRMAATILYNNTRPPKTPAIRNPKKLFGLPWDNEHKKIPQTREQMKAVMKIIAASTRDKPGGVVSERRKKARALREKLKEEARKRKNK